MSDEPTLTLVYDVDLRRPACVLIQAFMRGDQGLLYDLFPPRTWLVNPTPGMRRIQGTRAEWERAAKLGAKGTTDAE